MGKCGIYKIINPKGCIYIGQSMDLIKRIKSYKNPRKDQPKIYASIKKYGFENHKIEVIKFCEIKHLNDFEIYYIKKFNSMDKKTGLNLTSGGRDYFKHSDETKEKMSLCQMGNKKTLGRKQSKEEIEKRASKLRGQKRTEEQNKRSSEAHKGYVVRDDTKAKLRISLKGVNGKKVINTITGEIFESAKFVSDKYNIKITTLRARLNGQNKNETIFKYLINE